MAATPIYARVLPGDPAPWFLQRCTVQKGVFALDAIGGRFIVLCFLGSGASAAGRAALDVIGRRRAVFDDVDASLFGVSIDPDDERLSRLAADVPGIRYFWDLNRSVSRLYGALPDPGDGPYRPGWFVLDPMLRVLASIPFQGDDPHEQALTACLAGLPPVAQYRRDAPAPVLILPGVFEPGFCERLVAYYEASGHHASGVLSNTDGRVQAKLDPGFKRRRDCSVRDPVLVGQIQQRVMRRVVPMLQRTAQFSATHLERLLIACYDARDRGSFGPHRDNAVPAVAHRRFACSIALNDVYTGGELQFPEFGQRRYRAPAGAAILFSCSILHQVLPVTSGARFALLPFLFDEEGARIKVANAESIRQGNDEAAQAIRA